MSATFRATPDDAGPLVVTELAIAYWGPEQIACQVPPGCLVGTWDYRANEATDARGYRSLTARRD